ncbi:MAG: DUF4358 domain-containing protein [Angelakisella sp.]
MRRVLALLLVLALLFTGCGKKAPVPQPQPQLSQDITLKTLVDGLVEEYELPLPAVMDDTLFTGLLDISLKDVVQYHGYISMDTGAPDQIIGIEAAEGKAEALQKLMEARRRFVTAAQGEGTAQHAKAQSGTLLFRGNYLFLVIAGRPDADPAAEAAEIVEKLEDSFS